MVPNHIIEWAALIQWLLRFFWTTRISIVASSNQCLLHLKVVLSLQLCAACTIQQFLQYLCVIHPVPWTAPFEVHSPRLIYSLFSIKRHLAHNILQFTWPNGIKQHIAWQWQTAARWWKSVTVIILLIPRFAKSVHRGCVLTTTEATTHLST